MIWHEVDSDELISARATDLGAQQVIFATGHGLTHCLID